MKMINLNDYYLRAIKGRYVIPGLKLLHYYPDLADPNVLAPQIVTVTKVKKLFGAVLEYEYKSETGHGWCGGGIDTEILVEPLEDMRINTT